jgi:hypothetical protein
MGLYKKIVLPCSNPPCYATRHPTPPSKSALIRKVAKQIITYQSSTKIYQLIQTVHKSSQFQQKVFYKNKLNACKFYFLLLFLFTSIAIIHISTPVVSWLFHFNHLHSHRNRSKWKQGLRGKMWVSTVRIILSRIYIRLCSVDHKIVCNFDLDGSC